MEGVLGGRESGDRVKLDRREDSLIIRFFGGGSVAVPSSANNGTVMCMASRQLQVFNALSPTVSIGIALVFPKQKVLPRSDLANQALCLLDFETIHAELLGESLGFL